MATSEEMNQLYSDALAGNGTPEVIVLPLKAVRGVSNTETTRDDVQEFLRANSARDENLLVQVTEKSIQFV